MKASVVKVRQYLLSGVSFAIPFIACGGIMIAASIAINSRSFPDTPGDFSRSPAVLATLFNIGVAAFALMPAVLAGYISNSMAGKPGLVPGFVGGWLAVNIPAPTPADPKHMVTAGFLGAMVAGLIAGYRPICRPDRNGVRSGRLASAVVIPTRPASTSGSRATPRGPPAWPTGRTTRSRSGRPHRRPAALSSSSAHAASSPVSGGSQGCA